MLLSNLDKDRFSDWPLLQSTETGMDCAAGCDSASEATETNKTHTPRPINFIGSPFHLQDFAHADCRNYTNGKFQDAETATEMKSNPDKSITGVCGRRNPWDLRGKGYRAIAAQQRMLLARSSLVNLAARGARWPHPLIPQ